MHVQKRANMENNGQLLEKQVGNWELLDKEIEIMKQKNMEPQ